MNFQTTEESLTLSLCQSWKSILKTSKYGKEKNLKHQMNATTSLK